MAGLLNKKKRTEAEIPTSSMADIAFLLLIFFLVTTTIDVDTGIGMTLPPKLEEEIDPPPVKERNMLKILVNAQGQVLLEEKPASVARIREEVVTHVMNNGADEAYAESPDKAVISLKTQRGTRYEIYIDVLDEIMTGYTEIWNAEARRRGFESYEVYNAARQESGDDNEIRDTYPLNVSIAEPDPTEA